MDKLSEYQNIIKRVLKEYVERDNIRTSPGVERLLIVDDKDGHYIWLKLGWTDDGRINAPTIYVRLKGEKIWVEEDWTEKGFATDLLEAGVPKDDIVLAFHAPEFRQYTEFAAA